MTTNVNEYSNDRLLNQIKLYFEAILNDGWVGVSIVDRSIWETQLRTMREELERRIAEKGVQL